MNKIIGILFAVILGVWVNSCSDDPEIDYGDFIEVFATYVGEEDGMEKLSYQAHDDSREITLRVGNLGLDRLQAGDRIYLRYTVLNRISDDELEVRSDGAMKVVNDMLRRASADTIDMVEDTPIRVTSLWRTGNYINLNSWVPYVGSSFQLALIADDATLERDTVEAKLLYYIGSQKPTFERKCYASINIGNLWRKGSCKSLRIYVNDPKGKDYYEFNK